ncbi:MAG: hypothetical protein JWN43_1859 [Gammaproteobacteria bacterium]|nr:hypothetical protein [Gammaproteobacteria bacterium]
MSPLNQLLRVPYVHGLWTRFPLAPVRTKVYQGLYPYPHYAYGVYWSAFLAQRLKIPRITAIEFGVAGGRGLLALEKVATEIEAALGVGIDVIGFDSGEGMPEPTDYRDLPHIWGRGFYRMDHAKLRARLSRARLVIGDVRETIREEVKSKQLAPLGFVSFDLDYYSSTKAALGVFAADGPGYLPRVHCYFDDVAANDLGCMNEHVGELLAIREFNAAHPSRKISKFEQLRLSRPRWEHWQEKMYVMHDFAHPQYTTPVILPDIRHTQRHL